MFLARHLASPLREPLDQALGAREIMSRSGNPAARLAYRNNLGYSLVLAARYAEAEEVANEAIDDAQSVGMQFPLLHLLHVRALAFAGMRKFGRATVDLNRAIREAERTHNPAHINVTLTGRLRILLAQHRLDDAARLADVPIVEPNEAIVGFFAEYEACRGLTLAAVDRLDEALHLVADAEIRSRTTETQTTAAWTRVIVSLRSERGSLPDAIADAVRVTLDTGALDSFVCAYRAAPDLLVHELTANLPREFTDAIANAHDWRMAREAEVPVARERLAAPSALTGREREVYDLLAQGLSNRAIATALYISEVTVKLHVRRILAKVGARSRAEAAARYRLAAFVDDSTQPAEY